MITEILTLQYVKCHYVVGYLLVSNIVVVVVCCCFAAHDAVFPSSVPKTKDTLNTAQQFVLVCCFNAIHSPSTSGLVHSM